MLNSMLLPLVLTVQALHLVTIDQARVQGAGPSDVKALVDQCTKAQTPLECRAALPSCEAALNALVQAPAGLQIDPVRDRILHAWAWCEKELGQYAQAEGHCRSLHELRVRMHGREHPAVASSLNYLAGVLNHQGKYAEAETVHRQALVLRRKLLGEANPQVADSLDNLAIALELQGKYAQAESLHRQALVLRRKLLGEAHPSVAISLNRLAIVLDDQGKYAEAEMLHRQALALHRKLLGETHPDIATSLDNLAGVLDDQGKYAEAETLHRHALALYHKLLGEAHPDVATSMDNLAGALDRQGRYAEAESLHRQALALYRNLLGEAHPDVAASLNNLAAVFLAMAAPDRAVPLFRQAASIREAQLRATVSETRMQAIIDKLRGEEDAIYGLLLGDPSPDAAALGLSLALLRKGRIADAGAAANRLLHRSLTSPALAKQFEDWQALRAQREGLLYAGPGALSPGDYQARLKGLKEQAESLEYLLVAELPELRNTQLPGFDDIVLAVARRLPQDAALVEIVWVEPYQPTSPGGSWWGAPHYLALLLFSDQRIVTLDLGEAAKVDREVRAMREELESSTSDPIAAARALYDRILRPVMAKLQGRTRLYLSLDGTLQLVPFDALHDGTDYLLGRYRFHYLTSGRDLLRQPSQEAARPALLLANPTFGKAEAEGARPGVTTLYQRLGVLSPLPGTEREAQALKSLLQAVPLVGEHATEAAVRAARTPRVLHIATHGLFLDDAELPAPVEGRGLRSVFAERSKPAPLHPSLLPASAEPLRLPGDAGPFSRSALVLAGAAAGGLAKSPAEDGLLTADEARSLDLYGTQLVVLSACETGKGVLSAGQGVYGLRRAFLVAGAETLVTSLWRVHDDATGELMALYYGKLFNKQKPRDRLGGMIEAMQELRRRPGRAHPYYWAPFLVIGQDGPLRP